MSTKFRDITFIGNLLTINDSQLDLNEFKESFEEKDHQKVFKTNVNLYNLNFVDHYLQITFGSGSTMPRNPKVINIETQETMPNPRQSNQVEPKNHFAIIDFNRSYLWLSNSKKKKALINFVCETFNNKKIIIKDVYDKEKFINTIKRLDNIKISSEPNLFTETNTLTKELCREINGYDAALATLTFKYEDKFVGDNLVEKIKSLITNKNTFKNIVISGRDEKGLGMLFNKNEFSRKIEFKSPIDENEMFLTNEVFQRLITKIENEQV